MSIVAQGNSRSNWVCRCRKGLLSRLSPRIHIFDGEKVCIQRMRPPQAGSPLAATQRFAISSDVVTIGLKATGSASAPDPSSALATVSAWVATCARVSGP